MKLLMTGDAILAAPWSSDECERFRRLVREIREADVSIANLEIPLTDFKGHPQVDSGGMHLTASGDIADELRWAGFQMVSHANNHSYDYGAVGLLKTLENVEKSGLILSGAGTDLQAARAPRVLEHEAGVVALVSMTTCLQPYAHAGRSRAGDGGRPGLNPLSMQPGPILRRVERAQCKFLDGLGAAGLPWSGVQIARPDREHELENLRAIREARDLADYVVVSLHSHVRGGWRHRFARQAIDAGADVVFMHGRHYVQGVEIYQQRPIFYGLGDFAFELHKVKQFPDQIYRRYGLDDDATVDDLNMERRGNRDRGYDTQPEVWRGIVPTVEFTGERLSEINILPVDLGYQGPDEELGRPRMAEPELAEEIINEVARLSKRYRCQVDYCAETNSGKVRI